MVYEAEELPVLESAGRDPAIHVIWVPVQD